jgi:hypothetical protein
MYICVADRIRRCITAGIAIAVIFALSTCRRNNETPKASPTAPPSSTNAKPDPLLGKWIMIGDNGTDANGTIADYRADGTVVFTEKGKEAVVRYRRETGKSWVDRRTNPHNAKELGPALDRWRKPGVEMIEFADSKGKFYDYGGTLLTLDPDQHVLYNILTQLWCRPGDEAHVKAEFDIK